MATQDQTPEVRIKPVRVEAYRCTVEGCGRLLEIDYLEAEAHVNQPIGRSLPIGLVFNWGMRKVYAVIKNRGRELTEDHSPIYQIETFDKLLYTDKPMGETIVSSRAIKEQLLNGDSSLLDENQFQDFNRCFKSYLSKHKIVTVRTTPELEAILRGGN